jgi:hypothetical protein
MSGISNWSLHIMIRNGRVNNESWVRAPFIGPSSSGQAISENRNNKDFIHLIS